MFDHTDPKPPRGKFLRMRILIVACLIVSSGCWRPSESDASSEEANHTLHHTDQTASPYAAYADRQIKALSSDETEALLAGEGMRMALAAELNGYPGPKHVLELAPRLRLDPRQRQSVEVIFGAMKKNAEHLGARIVGAEAELDRAFAAGRISSDELHRRLSHIGGLRAELRTAHLQAHLQTKEVLSAQQTRRYQELRGYVPVDR